MRQWSSHGFGNHHAPISFDFLLFFCQRVNNVVFDQPTPVARYSVLVFIVFIWMQASHQSIKIFLLICSQRFVQVLKWRHDEHLGGETCADGINHPGPPVWYVDVERILQCQKGVRGCWLRRGVSSGRARAVSATHATSSNNIVLGSNRSHSISASLNLSKRGHSHLQNFLSDPMQPMRTVIPVASS
eukprot:m.311216 g.311216  ORF g.311216 m.311216 type:complete len:187 (+) comp16385_c0_seq60:1436-1996(+)